MFTCMFLGRELNALQQVIIQSGPQRLGWRKRPSPPEDPGGGEEKEEKHPDCGCSRGRMGTTRFDLDSALALKPIRGECPSVGFSS